MKIKYAPILYLKQGEVTAVTNMKNYDGFAPIIITPEEPSSSNNKYLSSISKVCTNFFHDSVDNNFSNSIIPIISNITSTSTQRLSCFICNINDILNTDINTSLDNIILCIDFGYIDEEAFDHISNWVLPNQKFRNILNKPWHSVIISSSSYPETSDVQKGESFIDRYEIKLYKVMQKIREDIIYSDHGTQNPVLVAFQPWMKPAAKIAYSLDDKYYLNKGTIWQNDPQQFITMAQSLIKKPFFMGKDFSVGDSQVEDIATTEIKTGNLTTWKSISMNHHFELTMNTL